MKHLIFLLTLIIVPTGLLAQSNFQGTIKYSWKFSGEGVEQFEFMMPTGTTLITSKFGSRLSFEGGMMASMMGEFVYNTKKKKSYTVKVDEKTASELPDTEEADAGPEPTITKENEVINILGYDCQKYSVVTVQDGEESTQYIWTTDKIKVYDSGNNSSMAMGGTAKVDGFPMKVLVEQEGMTIMMMVTELSPGSPSKALFSIPKDYTMEPYDPSGGFGM